MPKYNGYSEKVIKRLFEIGMDCEQEGMTAYEVVDRLAEQGFTSDDSYNIALAGMKYGDRITIKEKIWYRIGEPVLDWYGDCYKSSYNYSDERPEDGVSVVTIEWLHSLKAVFFGAHDGNKLKNRGVYKIKGVQIGFGGDDEPVIYATDWAEKTRIHTFKGLEKAVKTAQKFK